MGCLMRCGNKHKRLRYSRNTIVVVSDSGGNRRRGEDSSWGCATWGRRDAWALGATLGAWTQVRRITNALVGGSGVRRTASGRGASRTVVQRRNVENIRPASRQHGHSRARRQLAIFAVSSTTSSFNQADLLRTDLRSAGHAIIYGCDSPFLLVISIIIKCSFFNSSHLDLLKY